jgi:TatA/E family protein of Tat protein translocase
MPELIIILVIALIIFGPRKLPELGRSLGKSIGEFRKASNELKSTLEEEIRLEEQKEQRAKMEAEQASAVAAGAVTPAGPAEEPTAVPAEEPQHQRTAQELIDEGNARVARPADATVSRTTTGTGTPA